MNAYPPPRTAISSKLVNSAGYLIVCACLLVMLGALQLQIAGIDTGIPLQFGAGGSLRIQIVLAICYVVGAIMLIGSPDLGVILRGTWPIFIVPGLALLSMAWSPEPFLTARKGIALFGTMLFGVAVASRFSFKDAMRLVIRVMALAIVLSVVWVVLIPYQGIHQVTDAFPFENVHAGSWRGIFGHRGTLALFSALTFCFLLLYGRIAFQHNLIRYGAIGLSLACVVAAKSGGGFLATALLPIVAWGLSMLGQAQPRMRLVLLPFILITMLIFVYLADNLISVVLDILGKQSDFTGRIPFWGYLIGMADQRPLLGYGYAAGFAKIVAPEIAAIGYGSFINAHNGYIEALVAFGYVGLTICLIVLAWQITQATKLVIIGSSENAVTNSFPLTVLIYVCAVNVIESTLMAENSWYVILPAMVAGLLAREYRRPVASRPQLRFAPSLKSVRR